VAGVGDRPPTTLAIQDNQLLHPARPRDDVVILTGVLVINKDGHQRLGASINRTVNPMPGDVNSDPWAHRMNLAFTRQGL
jgi:hypothetical protein